MRDYLYRVITDQEHSLIARMLQAVLSAVSVIYGAIVITRNYFYAKGFYRSFVVQRPVISVGNITWGGVGKTPFVILIAQYLRDRGFKPAVLTRGYMKKNRNPTIQADEPQMIRQIFPDMIVGVGPNRWQVSQEILLKYDVDVFILDDGFQHRRLKRDLDIVLVDTTNPFGNQSLIPRGILREPLAALKRAQIVILTKSDAQQDAAKALEEHLRNINPACLVAQSIHAPTGVRDVFSGQKEALAILNQKNVIGFCGIGDPQSFQRCLSSGGLEIVKSFVFDDHHSYSVQDMKTLLEFADKLKVVDFVTTAKDSVKLLPFKEYFDGRRCWILDMEIQITQGKEKVFERIDHLLGR